MYCETHSLPPPPQFVSRLAALLGKELVLKHFVSLFASLGSDTMFHVRKVCMLLPLPPL